MGTQSNELLQPTNYNTFTTAPPEKVERNAFCILFISTFIMIAFNASALGVGLVFNNNTCYNEQKIISLSLWLIVCGSLFLTYQVLLLGFYTIVLLFRDSIPNYDEFVFCNVGILTIMKIGLAIFKLIMFVIGIVELVHQYPGCHTEVKPVTSMVIIIIIINAAYYIGLI